MDAEDPDSGWQLVASTDEAAALFAALVELDTSQEFTRSNLAAKADVPLKTLYLVDTLETLVDVGVLQRVDEGEDSEARYRLNEENPVLTAAREFDEAVTEVSG